MSSRTLDDRFVTNEHVTPSSRHISGPHLLPVLASIGLALLFAMSLMTHHGGVQGMAEMAEFPSGP